MVEHPMNVSTRISPLASIATVAFAPPLMPRRTAIPSFRPLGLYGLIPTTRAPESAADAVPLPSRHR